MVRVERLRDVPPNTEPAIVLNQHLPTGEEVAFDVLDALNGSAHRHAPFGARVDLPAGNLLGALCLTLCLLARFCMQPDEERGLLLGQRTKRRNLPCDVS